MSAQRLLYCHPLRNRYVISRNVSLLSNALKQRSLLSPIVTGRRHNSQTSNSDNNNNSDEKSQRSIKDMLKEDIRTIPNMLTMSRLLLSPAIGYWIYAQDYKFALGAFAFASVTDLVDGYIARKFNQRTYLGTVLDPLADKVLMTTVTLSLATTSLLPTYLAALIVGRDVLLSAAVMVYRYMSLSKPRTFKKYIDPTIPSVEIKPTQISKYNTFLQLVLMGSSLSAPVIFGVESHWLLSTMQYTVAASTVLSGASYVFAKDAVKVLKQKTTSAGAKSPENKVASASSKSTSSKVNADQKK